LYSYSIEELALFDVETLCEILSDEQIVVENEDSLFEIIVNLGSDYYCLFDYLRFEYLNVSNISRFIEMIDLSSLSSKMWSSLCVRLKSVSTFPLNPTSHRVIPIESLIVSTLPISFWTRSSNRQLEVHRESGGTEFRCRKKAWHIQLSCH
jgi:hypothetical protein